MHRELWDSKTDDWMAGYVVGRETRSEPIVLTFYCWEDELYCIERQDGIWEMIDSKTALEWGL